MKVECLYLFYKNPPNLESANTNKYIVILIDIENFNISFGSFS